MRSLLADFTALDRRVDFVRLTLSAAGQDVPRRVAASVVHLGVVGRILAPALAAVALGGRAPLLTADELWWQDDLGGVFPLSVSLSAGMPGDDRMLDGVIGAFSGVFEERYGVPARTLSGNVASTVNSAARQLAVARPALGDAARLAADAVLSDERVEGGRLRAGPGFRRRSCCLIYQAAGSRAGVCGDCVLTPGA